MKVLLAILPNEHSKLLEKLLAYILPLGNVSVILVVDEQVVVDKLLVVVVVVVVAVVLVVDEEPQEDGLVVVLGNPYAKEETLH